MTYPPPPPPPSSSTNLGTIRTYILIAFIFSIISAIAWVIAGLFYISLFAAAAATAGTIGVGFVAAAFLLPAIVFLVMMVFAILVFLRVWKMHKAVNAGDIATLKATSNIVWAIIALIFAGVIPGIMLILADGPIKQL
jgi:putative membrane protein